MENGQEVIVERSATEEEISAAIAEMKEDVKTAYADMKAVRNLKTHNEEIPIPNSCSANVRFMGNLKKMVTGKEQPFISHSYNTYVMEHPEEVRVFLRKNLHLLQLTGGQSDKSIEMYKKNLDRMSFAKDKVYTDKDLDDDVRDLMEIANKLQKFSYHVAPRVVDDEEEGLITVEGMAAATDQYMVSPFTMNAIIGQYKGKKELIEEGKAYEHEGFSKFNNAIPPYSTTVKDALKCRMKDFLSYASKQELQ